MANKVIGDYGAALSIDGSTHYLLIQPGSSSTAYNKINRNVFLGVTGQPVDISTSQNLTNKTFNNTNIFTLRDDRFTLQDNVDTTKQAQFQLSGITTATTRTYTLPNASSTIADISTVQTLTNKTLTSPVITGGSISNSTIAVDAIGEFTLNNGVTIDGLNIMNGALNTNNSVVTSNITDTAVTPAKLQSGTGAGWSFHSWTVTWTNFTLGNGSQTANYIQMGKTVFYYLTVNLGSTSIMGTGPIFSLPVTATAIFGTKTINIGNVYMSTGGNHDGYVYSASTSTGGLLVFRADATYLGDAAVTASVPSSWATNDAFYISGWYEAA